jgi:hypothetical protein
VSTSGWAAFGEACWLAFLAAFALPGGRLARRCARWLDRRDARLQRVLAGWERRERLEREIAAHAAGAYCPPPGVSHVHDDLCGPAPWHPQAAERAWTERP